MSSETQTKEKKEKGMFTKEEICEMFDKSFLPILQEFAIRTKEKEYKDQEIEFFNVQMVLQFDNLVDPLTYESIQNKVHMQLQPVTKEDLEKAEKKENDGSSKG